LLTAAVSVVSVWPTVSPPDFGETLTLMLNWANVLAAASRKRAGAKKRRFEKLRRRGDSEFPFSQNAILNFIKRSMIQGSLCARRISSQHFCLGAIETHVPTVWEYLWHFGGRPKCFFLKQSELILTEICVNNWEEDCPFVSIDGPPVNCDGTSAELDEQASEGAQPFGDLHCHANFSEEI